MTAQTAQALITSLQSGKALAAHDAVRLVQSVYQDGIVSRAEAGALILLNEALSAHDAQWPARFVEMVKDYVLSVEPPAGWVSAEEADWLIGLLGRDGHVCAETEMELVLSLLSQAEGAPERLGRFALEVQCARMRSQGLATAAEVERLRRVLFASAGLGAVWVTREEAEALFALNDAIGFAVNDASWNALFSRAIANHLMSVAHPTPDNVAEALRRETWLAAPAEGVGGLFAAMIGSFAQPGWFARVMHDPKKAEAARLAAREAAAASAATVNAEEEAWFLRRLGWNKRISPAERALVDFLRAEAPGFVNGLALAA